MLMQGKSGWVPISTAARELGISRQSVRRLMERGVLAKEFSGTVWLVSVATIESRKLAKGRKRS